MKTLPVLVLPLALFASACGGPAASGGGPTTGGTEPETASTDGAASEPKGARPPDFELPTLTGDTVRLSDHLGKDVVLEYDVECTDRFGRNLAYVYADGVLVSESLISGGFGCSLGIAPDVLYQPALDAAEARAKNAGAGQWSACEASQRKESCAN